MSDIIYFAYGSNLGVPRLKQRCPSVMAGKVASLPDWELCFDKKSSDGSSKANIRHCVSAVTWGALFHMPEEDLWT